MKGLDLETSPRMGHPQPYALQPWRALKGHAGIDSCGVATSDGKSKCVPGFGRMLQETLEELEGETVVTWNGGFDIAWLLASGFEKQVKKINWLDGMLIWKWVENSQRKETIPKWSLADGAKRWLADWPQLDLFLQMKDQDVVAGADDEYWELRGKLDAFVTVKIAELAWAELTDQQKRSVKIEAMNLIPVAQSWVNGIPLDTEMAAAMAPAVTEEMMTLEVALGVVNPEFQTLAARVHTDQLKNLMSEWAPSKILRSPKQKGELLYDTWGHTCKSFTDKGARATDKAAMTYLADHDDRALDLLRWSELNTQYTKFIVGIAKAEEYLGSNVVHPSPRIFSTYTGRITYASKSGQKGEAAKAKIGVPIHQWPRNKQLRKLIGN